MNKLATSSVVCVLALLTVVASAAARPVALRAAASRASSVSKPKRPLVRAVKAQREPGAKRMTLRGEVDPRGQLLSSCAFEYGTVGGGPLTVVPCTPSPGAVNEWIVVSVQLPAPAANTTFEYRLTATDVKGSAKSPIRHIRIAKPSRAEEEAAAKQKAEEEAAAKQKAEEEAAQHEREAKAVLAAALEEINFEAEYHIGFRKFVSGLKTFLHIELAATTVAAAATELVEQHHIGINIAVERVTELESEDALSKEEQARREREQREAREESKRILAEEEAKFQTEFHISFHEFVAFVEWADGIHFAGTTVQQVGQEVEQDFPGLTLAQGAEQVRGALEQQAREKAEEVEAASHDAEDEAKFEAEEHMTLGQLRDGLQKYFHITLTSTTVFKINKELERSYFVSIDRAAELVVETEAGLAQLQREEEARAKRQAEEGRAQAAADDLAGTAEGDEASHQYPAARQYWEAAESVGCAYTSVCAHVRERRKTAESLHLSDRVTWLVGEGRTAEAEAYVCEYAPSECGQLKQLVVEQARLTGMAKLSQLAAEKRYAEAEALACTAFPGGLCEELRQQLGQLKLVEAESNWVGLLGEQRYEEAETVACTAKLEPFCSEAKAFVKLQAQYSAAAKAFGLFREGRLTQAASALCSFLPEAECHQMETLMQQAQAVPSALSLISQGRWGALKAALCSSTPSECATLSKLVDEAEAGGSYEEQVKSVLVGQLTGVISQTSSFFEHNGLAGAFGGL